MMNEQWRLDRRISVAVLFAIIMQMVAAVVWVTELDARVAYIENKTVDNATANEKFARLEERLEYLKENISVIRKQIDVVTERILKK